MTSSTPLDERIAAYLDGALSEQESAAFEAEMDVNPQLASEVERLAMNDTLVREAFASPITAGVDEALLERMGLGAQPAAKPSVITLAANDNPPFWKTWKATIGGAIAAALALTIMLTFQTAPGSGPNLNGVLDSTPSGQVVTLADGRDVRPVLTFVSGDGRYCREFSVGAGNAGESGIACRSGAQWEVEAKVKGATRLADSSQIEAASGDDGAALDAAYARLKAGDPLDAEREKALITGGWAPNGK